VAISSQGITVTWGGTAFQEVRSVSWDYGGNSQGRQNIDVGRAVVSCLGTANTSTANHGIRRQLVITGGGHDLTIDAIWDSVSAVAELNGVSSFTVVLRLVKD